MQGEGSHLFEFSTSNVRLNIPPPLYISGSQNVEYPLDKMLVDSEITSKRSTSTVSTYREIMMFSTV